VISVETGLCSPERPLLVELLRRTRDRRRELVVALGGERLRVQVEVGVPPTTVHRISFTPAGYVLLLQPENLIGDEFHPDLVLRGTPEQLVHAVLDPAGLAQAEAVVEQRAPTAPWEPILRLVRRELEALLGPGEDGPASDGQRGGRR
jgi:hypothetical protein